MSGNAAIAWGLALLVAAAALLPQAAVTDFPFVALGDDALLLANPAVRSGFSWENAGWAFSSTWSASWSPLAWISHMVDFSAYGNDAGGHHRTNLVLHALNALLLFGALRTASGQTVPSAGVALLLALHPQHVESVAWVSERRGLLAATFGFAALWFYVAGARAERPWLRLTLLFFALSLLAKPTLLVLPLLFVLLDHWPLGRTSERSLRSLVLEKWPYLLLSVASAVVTLAALRGASAAPGFDALGLGARLANALVCAVLYLWKLVLPIDLAVFYPHPNLPGGTPWSAVQVLGASAVLALLGTAAWRAPVPALRVGLLWYAASLLPVLGLVQVGSQAMADRYTYLPAVGVYVAAVFPLFDAFTGRPLWLRSAGLTLFCATLALLGMATRGQVEIWRSSERLFSHATEVTEGNYSMHFSLANTLKARGRIEEAIAEYQAAVRVHPELGEAHFNLANTLQDEDRLEEATEHYRLAAEALPGFTGAQDALGRALIRQGDLDASIEHYRAEAARRPDSLEVQVNLAHLLRLAGELEESLRVYEAAARLAPDDERWPRTIAQVREALESAQDAP